jgi:hypothetical protein
VVLIVIREDESCNHICHSLIPSLRNLINTDIMGIHVYLCQQLNHIPVTNLTGYGVGLEMKEYWPEVDRAASQSGFYLDLMGKLTPSKNGNQEIPTPPQFEHLTRKPQLGHLILTIARYNSSANTLYNLPHLEHFSPPTGGVLLYP